MAVTGQFGKIITGSGSVASAISGIASSYITLRLNRIYNAFINKESFEGREVTAAVAIELLNKMMAITSKGGKSQMDVEETLRAVRKANRTRTLNEVDTELKERGAIGDYANKVRVLEEMLLDPTLNPDETSDLKDELNDAIDDLLINSQNQFAAGGKVTLNGKTIDFAGGANEMQLLSLFDEQIRKNPDVSEKLNKQRVTAEASIFVAKANAAWLSKSRTTDALKSEGYTAQLKFLQQAYDLLNSSKYGLATEAQKVMTDIRSIQENQATAKKNMGGISAGKAVAAGYENIFGDLDLIDSEMKKDPVIAAMFGAKDSFAGFLMSDQNYAISILDKYIANNGSSVLRSDGTKISLTVENIADLMKDARVAANGLSKWAKGNSNVSESDKAAIKSYDMFATALGKASPILTTEDKYDDAVDDLSKGMDAAGSDIAARAAALRAFAKQLRVLGSASDIPTSVKNSLFAEADLYLTGKRPADGVTLYGDYSGNLSGENNMSGIYNIDEILGGVISPGVGGERTSIFSAISALYAQEADWIAGGGKVITDIDGNDVPETGTQDTSAWEKGQSIRIKTLSTITLGENGVKIKSLVDQDLQRIRIVQPGAQANPDDIDKYTMGFIARVKQADGTFKYIVTQQNADNTERILTGAASAEFVRVYLKGGNWSSFMQTYGGNRVIELPAIALDGKTLVNPVKPEAIAEGITPSNLSDGRFWEEISASDSGYGWAKEYQTQVDNSILAAIKAKELVVRKGRVYLPGGKKIGGSQGEVLVDLDLTDYLSPDMLAKIVALEPGVDTGAGEGEGEGGKPDPAPVGKEKWTGTAWAGQEGSTVISTTAGGKPLTLDEAFSGGTGFMWDKNPPKTGTAPKGSSGGNMGKGTLDPKIQAEYDRLKSKTVQQTGMKNVVSGKANAAIQADSGSRMLTTFMRNMPTGAGKTGTTPTTGSKPVYKQPERRRNV